jgi:hypothetical protein
VFAACFAKRGFADWLPYNKKLAASVKAAGGEAMFSLGATWLGMATPPPAPPPSPPPSGESLNISVSDPATGRKGSATVSLMSAASAVILAGAVMLAPKPPAEAIVSTPPIVESEVMPHLESRDSPADNAMPPAPASVQPRPSGGFDFSGSSFYFDRQGHPVPMGSGR